MIDSVSIVVKAGDGGPGSVSFRREKFVPKGGPDGGDGGKGGDVILLATSQLQTLMDLTLKSRYTAPNGQSGGKKKCYGTDGDNLIIRVPCGTMVFDGADPNSKHKIMDLLQDGDTYCVAKGGKGGQGNARFATSVNQAPRYAQPGLPGDERVIQLELRLIAQIGLVGVPNAGKSTLLQRLTHANPKIADYPFTTLFPNLGVLRWNNQERIMADIPGLIEGASQGAGLGATFLRHIDRTELLVHVVPISPGDPEQTWHTYQMICSELGQSEYDLLSKPSVVVLSKSDLVDDHELLAQLSVFQDRGLTAYPVSSATHTGIQTLIQVLMQRTANAIGCY